MVLVFDASADQPTRKTRCYLRADILPRGSFCVQLANFGFALHELEKRQINFKEAPKT